MGVFHISYIKNISEIKQLFEISEIIWPGNMELQCGQDLELFYIELCNYGNVYNC